MALKNYSATVLTGGGSGALDSIDGTNLQDKDSCIVFDAATFYFYTLDDDSGAAESSPDVISPDANAGNKRWLLMASLGIGGVITLGNTGLHILDSNATHDLIIKPGSNLTTDKTLTLTTGDADRTITLSGNPTLADWFDQTVKAASSPTFANATITTAITLANTGLHLLDSNASHDLIIKPGSDLTADRTLTLTTGDADRTVTLGGNLTIAGTTTISAFGATLIDDSTAAVALGTLGLTATAAEINKIDGFTGTYTDLNYAKDLRATGVTATEFDRICDGITATAAEVNTTSGGTAARNAHVHSNLTMTAGTGITGGGTLAASRTFSHTAHTGDVTGSTALTIGAAKVTQAKLKTSTQDQSYDIVGEGSHLFVLTGGQYCFIPTVKGESSVILSGGSSFVGTAYATYWNFSNSSSSFQYGYCLHRYVTSSGEVNWLFILRDKNTGKIIGRSIAPDHPCFGNGGKPLLMPHPFGSYDETKHEVIVINPSNEEIEQMEEETIVEDETKPDKSLIEVIADNYKINEYEEVWPDIPVTVGLPKHIKDKHGKKILADYRFMKGDTIIEPVKKVIPKPSYIKCKSLKRK